MPTSFKAILIWNTEISCLYYIAGVGGSSFGIFLRDHGLFPSSQTRLPQPTWSKLHGYLVSRTEVLSKPPLIESEAEVVAMRRDHGDWEPRPMNSYQC